MTFSTSRVSFISIPALLLICLTLLAATPRLAGAQSNNRATSIEEVVATAVGDVDAIWGEILGASGLGSVSPDVILYEGVVSTACGDLSAGQFYGFYCDADVTIYLDAQGLTQVANDHGAFAVAVVIADVWGYFLQDALGTGASGDALTVGATCLAGVWTWFAADLGLVNEADLSGALSYYASLRDGEVLTEVFIFGFETDSVADCFVS